MRHEPSIIRSSLSLSGLLVALLALPATAGALERYEGVAHAAAGDRVVYRETHWLYRDGGKPARLVLYRCADGAPFARKTMREVETAQAPDFDFVDGRDGYREGVRSKGARRWVYWQAGRAARTVETALRVDGRPIIDAGFDAFVRDNWARAATGEALAGQFLLPSRGRTLPVRVRAEPGQADLLTLRMKLDAWYGFIAPETRLQYRRADRRLVNFAGISTIRDARGKHQAVRVHFPAAGRSQAATQAELDSALAAPLAARCPAEAA